MKKLLVLMIFGILVTGCSKAQVTEQKPDQERKQLEHSRPEEAIMEVLENSKSEPESGTIERIESQPVESATELPEKYAGFNEITINGTKLTIPCNYETLQELGFKQRDPRDLVFPGQTLFRSLELKNQDGSDSLFVTQFSYQGPEKSVDLEDSDLVSFEWDIDMAGNADISFYGGIHKGSTEEEVAALLPQVPTAGEGRTQYEIVFDKMGYTKLEVVLLDGVVSRVTVSNFADYM